MDKAARLASFFEQMRRAPGRVLFLDYDGTLAPFREERDKATPYPELQPVLQRLLEHASMRLVIISGRAVADLIPLLGMDPPPEIWGSHGWERLSDSGEKTLFPLSESFVSGIHEAKEWALSHGWSKEVETKPASVAIHWRGASENEMEKIRQTAGGRWREIAERTGLELKEFDGGLELRAAGRDKGVAVGSVLDEMPKGTAAAYLGDDLTDEDAFRALRGKGLSVLVREQPRDTAAEIRIVPPKELFDFIYRWRENLPVE